MTFLNITKYIFIAANQNILCDIFFVKIVLSCSSNLFIVRKLFLQFSSLFFISNFSLFFLIIYLVFQTRLNSYVNCDINIQCSMRGLTLSILTFSCVLNEYEKKKINISLLRSVCHRRDDIRIERFNKNVIQGRDM